MLRLITPRMMMKKIPRYPKGSHKKLIFYRPADRKGGGGGAQWAKSEGEAVLL